MYSLIKNVLLQQLGVVGEETVQGQSAEHHKELTDKAYVRNLLVSLCGEERPSLPIVYGEEVSLKWEMGNVVHTA